MPPDQSIFVPLSVLQARVVAVLYEKEKTVPDVYPMSLNALTAGCNQRNNRDPVMDATDADVQQAVDVLKSRTLVIETSGARVTRHAQNLGRVLRVPEQAVAILVSLMLRGPQTAAELRINAERLHRFADVGSVEAFLEELATRPDDKGGALAQLLPRAQGAREQRWAHLLCGPVAFDASSRQRAASTESAAAEAEIVSLRAAVEQLSAELVALRERVAMLEGRQPPS